MHDMIVRQYQSSDLKTCRHLWLHLTEWHREIYQSPTIGGDNPGLLFDEHLGRVGAEHIWLAEIDGKVIGMTGLIPRDGEAELEPMIVNPEYRGLGVGRHLVETVIEEATKRGWRQLQVRPVARNRQAIQFFHELGFKVLGYIELFQELKPDSKNIWIEGEQIAGRRFEI